MSAPARLRVPVPGGDLTVHARREPRARPVLAVHGITASGAAWTAVADRTERPLIAPDLVGLEETDA